MYYVKQQNILQNLQKSYSELMCLTVKCSFLIWSATTANPFPASPALAASIEALSANRLVREAISSISVIILPISLDISVICSISVSKTFIFSFSSFALFAEQVTHNAKEVESASKSLADGATEQAGVIQELNER